VVALDATHGHCRHEDERWPPTTSIRTPTNAEAAQARPPV